VAGVAIEDALELWASSLREVKRRIRPLFSQERVAASAGLFLDGLLGAERRKTGWMRAEAAGDPGPWRQQAILGRGRWQADALRDLVREYAVESLADADAVLVLDGWAAKLTDGFLKQGKASCGVARQYTGSAGKITNCQIGVFAAYVSRHGHAFIDRALYLPKVWTDDPTRLAAAHVPPEVSFATKPRLALAMIERAVAAGVPFALGCRRQPLLRRRIGRRPMGGRRQRPRRGRDRDRPAAGGQGLRARRQRLSPLQRLGR
jgi:SRSO17 transposase